MDGTAGLAGTSFTSESGRRKDFFSSWLLLAKATCSRRQDDLPTRGSWLFGDSLYGQPPGVVKRRQPFLSPQGNSCLNRHGIPWSCAVIRLERHVHPLPPGRSRTPRTDSPNRMATCGGVTPIQSLEHFWGRDQRPRRFAIFGQEYDFVENIVVRATCREYSPLEVSSKTQCAYVANALPACVAVPRASYQAWLPLMNTVSSSFRAFSTTCDSPNSHVLTFSKFNFRTLRPGRLPPTHRASSPAT